MEHVLYGESEVVGDCNYLVGVRLQGGADQLTVGIAAVDTSLNQIQVQNLSDLGTESQKQIQVQNL